MKQPWNLPLLLDGAIGTALIGAGMPPQACPEQWALDHPSVVTDLQRRYVQAGSTVLYTPTFGANRVRLKPYGLDGQVAAMNAALTALTRRVAEEAGGRCLVAGCIGSAGLPPEPWGDAPFDQLTAIYAEQADTLCRAGVDLLVCETMTSLTEARAALLAARGTGLPVWVTLTVDEHGRTFSSGRLLPAVITLQSLGASAVGVNCFAPSSPDGDWDNAVLAMTEPLAEAFPHATVPLIAKPNALTKSGNLPPEDFARHMNALLDAGAVIVGGCCGTTPDHIAALRRVLDNHPTVALREIDSNACAVESEAFFLSDNLEPTELLACDSSLADTLIEAEETANVALLVLSLPGDVDNLLEFGGMSRLPIALRTHDPRLLDDALRRFPGRLMVDTLSDMEPALLEEIAAKYGAVLY